MPLGSMQGSSLTSDAIIARLSWLRERGFMLDYDNAWLTASAGDFPDALAWILDQVWWWPANPFAVVAAPR